MKQHYILTEVQNSGALSLGLIDYENSGSIDYPIPANTSLEYSYFFFRLLLKIITNSKKTHTFVNNQYGFQKKNKIKRVKFLTKVLKKY